MAATSRQTRSTRVRSRPMRKARSTPATNGWKMENGKWKKDSAFPFAICHLPFSIRDDRRAIRDGAFSLVELMLVMAIIAVVAAIAMPRYSASLARYRADMAARRIVAALALAQAKARATSSSQTITFTAGGSYQILGMNDPDRPGQPYVVDLTA